MAVEHLNDDQLQDLLDGNLTDGLLQEAESHLTLCPACQTRVEQYRALYRGLTDESEFVLPENFAASVASLAQEEERGSIWMSWPVLGGGSVIAAAIAIAYAVGLERLIGLLKELGLAQSGLREDLVTRIASLVEMMGYRGELLFFGALALVMVAVLDRIVDGLKSGRTMFVM